MPQWTWERAVAAVIDGDGVTRGTAFFVGSDVALTCDHVLYAARKEPVKLKPVGASVAEEIIDTDRDEDLDLALVRVKPRPDRSWLALSAPSAVIGHNIYSHGFPLDHPVSRYPSGFPMDPARVTGETTLVWQGQLVQMLVLDIDVQNGMSGAPAVDSATDEVIGGLRFREIDGHAFAVPTDSARRRWPSLPVSQQQPIRSFADLTLAMPEALASTAWREFDPSRLHCVVVGSEGPASSGPGSLLTSLATEVFSSPAAKALWDAFRGA